MHDHVTYHAVVRYLQRVLGLPVEEWLEGKTFLTEKGKARLCCERAGMPVEAVRSAILCAPVLTAVRCGFKAVNVRIDGFCYVIKEGRVATIVTEEMRDKRTGQLDPIKTQSRASARKDMLRNQKRRKARNRNLDRLAEVDL